MQNLSNYFFTLNLTYEECENLYRPGINNVVVHMENGVKVQLPTKNLRPFVTRYGIKGRFRLQVNDKHKIHSLERIT